MEGNSKMKGNIINLKDAIYSSKSITHLCNMCKAIVRGLFAKIVCMKEGERAFGILVNNSGIQIVESASRIKGNVFNLKNVVRSWDSIKHLCNMCKAIVGGLFRNGIYERRHTTQNIVFN